MGDPPPPAAPPAPRFRIVQGRGIGERAPSSAPQLNQASATVRIQSTPSISAALSPAPRPQTPLQDQLPPQQLNAPLSAQASGNFAGSSGPSTPQPPVSGRGTPSGPGPLLEEGQNRDQIVTKCVRFFKTLINLSQQPEQVRPGQTNAPAKVKDLVVDVISGKCPVEEFTARLQDALRSQAQPHLLPFLQKTLPHLRNAIRSGEVTIEGLLPPDIPSGSSQPPANVPRGPDEAVTMNSQSSPGMVFPPQTPTTTALQNVPHVPSPPIATPVTNIKTELVPDVEMQEQPAAPQEEEVIQMRQLQENVFKSALLRPEDIMKKITQRMHEACYVEEEVLTLISDATEYRLRHILTELAVLAEHRLDPLRLNPNYVPVDDTRRQVKFLEDLDRLHEEQRENREKEALLRMSKNKGTAKDTVERAKEMQRADAEAKRNRDANAAAIAALSGPNQIKPRWDQTTQGGASNIIRPRTIRVNIRDLHSLAANDPLCQRSQIVHRLALGGGSQESM